MTVWKRDFSDRTFQRFTPKIAMSSYEYSDEALLPRWEWDQEMYEKRLADRGWVIEPKPEATRPEDV